MEKILEKEPVKRVQEFINHFDSKLKISILDTTARTATDAAESLGCEVGAIVKSLVFRADDIFLIAQQLLLAHKAAAQWVHLTFLCRNQLSAEFHFPVFHHR